MVAAATMNDSAWKPSDVEKLCTPGPTFHWVKWIAPPTSAKQLLPQLRGNGASCQLVTTPSDRKHQTVPPAGAGPISYGM